MNDRESFLNSINAAREKHDEIVKRETQRKKDIAALAEGLKKFDPVPTEEELRIQEQRQKDILALETHMAKLEQIQEEPIIEEVVEEIVESSEPLIEATEPEAIPLGAQPLPQFPEKSLVSKAVENLAKIPRDKYDTETDALPKALRKELDLMKKTLTDLHRFARNTSQMGGGGEVKLRFLDDVDRNSIANNMFLRYNTAVKKFEFANVTTAVDWLNVPSSIIANNLTLNGNSGLTLQNTSSGITFADSTFQNTAYIPSSFISTEYSGANVVVANTAQTYIVPIGTQVDVARNITIGSNNAFVISHTGKYLINYSVQYENNDGSQNDVYVWINQNNAPLANSSSVFTVPGRKNPSITGKLVAVSPIFLFANTGDKIQILTAAPDAPTNTISINTFATRTNPTIPVTPAVLLTIQEVN